MEDSLERRQVVLSFLILAGVLAALLIYKGDGAFIALREVGRTGMLSRDVGLLLPGAGSGSDPVSRSVRYLIIIGPALLFGILIAGAVRAFVSPRWIVQAFGRTPLRQQLVAGAAGAPLMLCSCCVAPVFSAVYERSRQLGSALAVALAAPSLNPAALALTFILFPTRIATARLAMAVVAVFGIAPLVARFGRSTSVAFPEPGERRQVGRRSRLFDFAAGCLHVAVRTVPLILVGVVVSSWLVERLPLQMLDSHPARLGVIAGAAFVAVPLALPTFFEVPLAFTLLGVHAPAGVAASVLFAGPAINLPSLLTIGRAAGWKLAVLLAVAVGAVACIGGLLVG